MTAYFDEAHREVNEVAKDYSYMKLADIEKRIVFDCTVAAMMPGFPDDLRLKINYSILKNGVESLPVNIEPADFEESFQHVNKIQSLVWDLHSVFHEITSMGLQNFNDNPKMPLLVLYSRAEEERENIVENKNND